MTQPLNYTTKAIADLQQLAGSSTVDPYDREGLRFVIDLLQRAEVFVLPDAGELMDRSKPRPEVPGQVFRPPFPVVALEYRAVDRGLPCHPIYEAAPSSRRIALAWEWDGKMPGGITNLGGPAPGEGVTIASISFMDELGHWFPVGVATMIPFDAQYETEAPNPVALALTETGRMTRQQLSAPKLEIRGALPLLPGSMQQIIKRYGLTQVMQGMSGDLMDEMNAYTDLCMALACNNVSFMQHRQPPRLNKARIKAGKPPLKDFHVLEIAGHGDGHGFGTGDNGVRSHLRRGHIRRLGPERITWVNATMVRGSRAGFVDKQYSIR